MGASKIMIIRHAEKPDESGAQLLGVIVDGQSDAESLSVQAWQRAGTLAGFFSPTNAALAKLGIAVPQVIFASDDKKTKSTTASPEKTGSHSKRPIETVTPLTARLGVPINPTWSLGQEPDLAKAAAASNGVVLICWQHQAIPAIANQLIPLPDPPSRRLGPFRSHGRATGSMSSGSLMPTPSRRPGSSARLRSSFCMATRIP
jgi:hypothetical protein